MFNELKKLAVEKKLKKEYSSKEGFPADKITFGNNYHWEMINGEKVMANHREVFLIDNINNPVSVVRLTGNNLSLQPIPVLKRQYENLVILDGDVEYSIRYAYDKENGNKSYKLTDKVCEDKENISLEEIKNALEVENERLHAELLSKNSSGISLA